MVFSANDNSGTEVVGVIGLQADKISPSGEASILIDVAKWPVWYATGERDLMDVDENQLPGNILTNVFPNPASKQLNLTINTDNSESFEVDIYNIYGQLLFSETGTSKPGITQKTIDIKSLPNGTYVVNISIDGRTFNHKIVKAN